MHVPDLFWAIEVKRSARINRRNRARPKPIAANYPKFEHLLLSFASEPLLIDGILCERLEP